MDNKPQKDPEQNKNEQINEYEAIEEHSDTEIKEEFILKEKDFMYHLNRNAGITAEGLFNSVRIFMEYVRDQIDQNIRFQLIVGFGACFLVAIIFFNMMVPKLSGLDQRKYLDYSESIDKIERLAWRTGKLIDENYSVLEAQKLKKEVDTYVSKGSKTAQYYVIDNKNDLIFTNDTSVVDINALYGVLQETQKRAQSTMEGEPHSRLIALKAGSGMWLIYQDTPVGITKYKKAGNLAIVLSGLGATLVFIFVFFIVSRQKVNYIQQLSKGVGIIAKGNLDYKVPELGRDELNNLALSINHMCNSLSELIETERDLEKSKQELITNISHDLRTPLTSILGYLKLVIDKKYDSTEQMEEYLQTVYSKAESLKYLIDDLFEYTKVAYDGIRLEGVNICLDGLIEQLLEEYIPVIEESGLTLNWHSQIENVWCVVDPSKIHRVFENLLSNAVKYSDKPGELSINLVQHKKGYLVSVKNPAASLEGVDLSRIFDRFFRLEASRSSDTGGTGLGLGIAKGIIEAHKGKMTVDYKEGNIIFNVWIPMELHKK